MTRMADESRGRADGPPPAARARPTDSGPADAPARPPTPELRGR